MTNCGACDESCCTTLLVPGGDYSRTYDLTDGGYPDFPDGGNATGEADPASVSSFRLDKYVVTVGRFRQFVEAWSQGTGYIPAPGSGKHTHLNGGNGLVDSAVMGGYEPGWVASDDTSVSPTSANLDCLRGYSTWTSLVEANENLPINCVEWQEAFAFCIWDGGFLPSEAEWEYAAAGGEEQREYPWGTAAPDNQYAIYGCDFPSGSGLCSGIANLPAVGTARRGAARWGHLDMAGEVYQWTLDWYAAYVDPCVDCAFASDGSNRVIRGGYFAYDGTYLLPSNRGNFPPSRVSGVGFRCARVP
jgi:formylglycine-generating enzyme required for sulfatase activity